ncbi:hypothetical protein ACHAQJ_009713 [Trichoderma viride]
MTPRYGSEDVEPAALGRLLQFYPSGRTAKNRFLKGSMAEVLATWDPKNPPKRGVPTDELVELYRRWGEGENSWGIITTGNIAVEFEAMASVADMIITPECPPHGERFEKFREIASAAKAHGSLILGEVNHPGRQLPLSINAHAISSSDVQLEPKFGKSFAKPRVATKAEMARVVEGFAHAAEYLEKAGFDGIELHGAHGYLISQFLTRAANLRTDEYGTQTEENRLRFISDIAKAIRSRVSPGFILSTKLNCLDFHQDGGVTPKEAKGLWQALEQLGFDFVELSAGTTQQMRPTWSKESTREREAFFLQWAESITKTLGPESKMKTYICGGGGLRSTASMLEALRAFDGIALARPAAVEPGLPAAILERRAIGTIQPLKEVENDLTMTHFLARSQMSQIGQGKEPIDHSDTKAMEQFRLDMALWRQKADEDAGKLDFIRAVAYTGPLPEHRTSQAA